MTPRSIDELRAASEHLHYEIEMLDYTAKALARTSVSNLRNALLESFTIHARSLLDVFFPSGAEENDVLAEQYFDDPMTWKMARGRKPDFDVRANVGTQIAHLSYERLGIGPEAKNWPVSQIHADLMRVVRAFEETAARERLSSTWQDFRLLASFEQPFVSTTTTNNLFSVSIPTQVNTPALNNSHKKPTD
jgi:hypothetical protein